MFRPISALFLLVALLATTAMAQDAQFAEVRLHVALSPASETPPITDVDAVGNATVDIRVTHVPSATSACQGSACENDEGFSDPSAIGEITAATVDFVVNYNTDSAQMLTAMHIHRGELGQGGGVVVSGELGNAFQVSGSGVFSRTVDVSDPMTLDILEEILQNPRGFYLNVHSQTSPSGLLRGQLRAVRNSAAQPSHADIVLSLRDVIATLTQVRVENAAMKATLDAVARRNGVRPTDPGSIPTTDLPEVVVPDCVDDDDDGEDDDTGQPCEIS